MLFSLCKQDFEEAMKNYPQAYGLLRKKARRVLRKDKKKAEEDKKKKAELESGVPDQETKPASCNEMANGKANLRPGLSVNDTSKGDENTGGIDYRNDLVDEEELKQWVERFGPIIEVIKDVGETPEQMN
ncbi:unnamed protein product [Protopolystoma xenopodis]|uniref:Uncharacterized protein n=1 Tax=Protopolystoma xenopodis TaxID=117903 RepID=A0A448XMU4_9PLAT|nr:unnamed protein product [Protopolystoma xenopodis]